MNGRTTLPSNHTVQGLPLTFSIDPDMPKIRTASRTTDFKPVIELPEAFSTYQSGNKHHT